MGPREILGSKPDQVLALVYETSAPAEEGGEVQEVEVLMVGACCPVWKMTKAAQMQSLSYHRKGEERVSQQSVEMHLQRPKMGG